MSRSRSVGVAFLTVVTIASAATVAAGMFWIHVSKYLLRALVVIGLPGCTLVLALMGLGAVRRHNLVIAAVAFTVSALVLAEYACLAWLYSRN